VVPGASTAAWISRDVVDATIEPLHVLDVVEGELDPHQRSRIRNVHAGDQGLLPALLGLCRRPVRGQAQWWALVVLIGEQRPEIRISESRVGRS